MCSQRSHDPGSPEEELLEKMRNGDSMAFKQLYEQYARELYFSAYNLFRDQQVCEDLVQDLFAHLWLKRTSLRIDSLKPYLFKAIRNRVLMAIRSGKAQPRPTALRELARYYSPDALLAEKEISRILDESVERLPERCRTIFHLSRKEYLSNKEIALRLNLSVKTVENQLTIALRRIRISLREFLFWAWLIIIQHLI